MVSVTMAVAYNGVIMLQHPVTWKPSADGRKVIGHMILHKGPDRDGSDIGGSLGTLLVQYHRLPIS